jgi:hypothetical protein
MKMGPVARGTSENESGSEKMNTGLEALGTTENESGSAKHKNGTRRPLFRPKRVQEHIS